MSYQSRYRIDGQSDALLSPASRLPTIRQRIVARLKLWRESVVARRHLAAMDARSLRDAGISPAAAAFESGKSFWEPMGPLR
ncbi:MAG: DUF1127 domain-containing protein [Reyranella sp.]|uniref:DUF1127 domain-containing protein n=1 Tax=Reyranella sp. TaxID=1929291 RepID=UPI003D104596